MSAGFYPDGRLMIYLPLDIWQWKAMNAIASTEINMLLFHDLIAQAILCSLKPIAVRIYFKKLCLSTVNNLTLVYFVFKVCQSVLLYWVK